MTGWVNASKEVQLGSGYAHVVAEMQAMLHTAWHSGAVLPSCDGARWARHVFREQNMTADGLASLAMSEAADSMWTMMGILDLLGFACRCRTRFDGGKRDDMAGCGWVMSISSEALGDAWLVVARCSFLISQSCSVFDSEILATHDAMRRFLLFLRSSRC